MSRVKVGIVGCGTIGSELALFIEKDLAQYFILQGIYDISREKIKQLSDRLMRKPKLSDFNGLISSAEMIIETASIRAAAEIIRKTQLDRKSVV